ncbi:MAG: ribbon-helix-helix domain-containing protein [Pseudomonadota bacterium]|nr:ribbon-helix-helix domain-containing protein [Pseudomonadota bacterium]
MKKISVSLSGHHTSISLEEEFVDALHKIAAARGTTPSGIINQIDRARGARNLSSAIRVWILKNHK